MNNELIKKLKEKDALVKGTEIKIEIKKLTRTVAIESINERIVYGVDLKTGESIKTTTDNIKKVDGMTIKRVCSLYNLNEDGTEKKVGKRRGRKRKTDL